MTYALFTDREEGTELPDGQIQLSYQNVPAWIVTFPNTRIPLLGVRDQALDAIVGWDVVIDAETGEEITQLNIVQRAKAVPAQ